jgi:uncharacterized protein involved in type VI secretion and phage assembly
VNENEKTFYGKYRGVVTDNRDPRRIGCIRARVPDVYGDLESGWAMPAAPFGGNGMGFFAVPAKGAGVWIEFECGDPDYPIWSGCWWGDAREMPPVLFTPPPRSGADPKMLIKTKGGHSILLDDSPDGAGITLETSSGQKIVINSKGIEISNGKEGASIKLSGKRVSINGNALEVE